MTKVCDDYIFDVRHLYLPYPHVLYKVCLIRDKSRLFLVSLTRSLIYYLIFDTLKDLNWIDRKGSRPKYFGYIIVTIFLILSIISLILSVLKIPVINHESVNKQVDLDVAKIEAQPTRKTGLETRSVGKSEAEKTLMPEVITPTDRIKSIS